MPTQGYAITLKPSTAADEESLSKVRDLGFGRVARGLSKHE